jgi:predicted transcriptional regulator
MENEKKEFTKRRDFNQELQDKLISLFGYDEFRITWKELGEKLGMPLQKIRYHITKNLVPSGFMQIIREAKRVDGEWEQNVFKIADNGEKYINPKVDDNVFRDVRKSVEDLLVLAKKSANLEEENRHLRAENQNLADTIKKFQEDILTLRGQIKDVIK